MLGVKLVQGGLLGCRDQGGTLDLLLHTTHYTLNNTHYTLHTTHYILHTTHYKLHTKHYTLHTTHYILHTTHYTLHTTHYTLHTTHYTHCSHLGFRSGPQKPAPATCTIIFYTVLQHDLLYFIFYNVMYFIICYYSVLFYIFCYYSILVYPIIPHSYYLSH